MTNPDLQLAVAMLAPVSILWAAFAAFETARIVIEIRKDLEK